MSPIFLRSCVVAALLTAVLAAAADGPEVPVKMIPVPSIPKTAPVEAISTTVVDLGGGVITSAHSILGAMYWGGLTHFDQDWYASVRGSHSYTSFEGRNDAPQGCCSDNIYETVLTVGIPVIDNHLLWIGAGPARVQRTKGDPEQDKNFVIGGGELELVLASPRHLFGAEGRLIGEFNGKQNYVGALVGIRFGG